MDDVLAVQVVHGGGDRGRQPDDFRHRQGGAGSGLGQVVAGDALHDEPRRAVAAAAGDQARHMRSRDPAEDHLFHLEADQAAGVAAEAQPGYFHQEREGRRRGPFQGIDGVQQRHAALVQQAADAKAADLRPGRKRAFAYSPLISRHASRSGNPASIIFFAAACAS